MTTTTSPGGQATVLQRLLVAARRNRRYDIGFPGATDLGFPELGDWLTGQLLNNIGDPADPGHGRNHTKDLELDVIRIVGQWLGALDTAWGYVTSGASEGTEHALDTAWQRYHDVVVYASVAAHYSVLKTTRRLKLPFVQVRTLADGQMDVTDLARKLDRRRDRPAMIVATAGTTMREAVDDVAAITAVCDDLAIARRFIHVDAALSGIPLALLPDNERPAFDFRAGATSIVVSGHKFLSSLMPCGVLVYAQPPWMAAGGRITYTGSLDTTIGGSRSGHTPLILWTILERLGAEGHRARAVAARDLAAYTHQQLTDISWPTWRNPHAMTVVLQTPPQTVLDKWVLAHDGHHAHIVTVPGITKEQIDDFLTDLQQATAAAPGPAPPAPARRPAAVGPPRKPPR